MSKPEEAAATSADELDKLFPQSADVQAGGKTITVRPLGIRKLGQIARPLKKIAEATDDEVTVVELFAEHHDELIEAVSVATGESGEWIGELLPDEFAMLVFAVVKVNADFFVRRLPALLGNVQATMASLGVGPTPSITSKSAGT